MKIRRSILALPLAIAALLALAGAAHAEGTPAPAWKVLAVSGPTNLPPEQSEVQRLTVAATEGTFTLAFEGQATTALPSNASASEVEAALNGLSTIGGAGGLVTVEGGPGGDAEAPYLIAFGGALANTDVEKLTVTGTTLGEGFLQVLTKVPGGPGTGDIAIFPTNVGGAVTSGPITVELGPLPAGVVTAGPAIGTEASNWSCTTGSAQVQCTYPEAVPALTPTPAIKVPVEVRSVTSLSSQVPVTVSGGGAAGPASYELPIEVSTEPAPAGIAAFFSVPVDADGQPATQAGGHPNGLVTAFHVNSARTTYGKVLPSGDIKDVKVDLQPGFVGDPLITERCPQGLPAPKVEGLSPACNEAEKDRFRVGQLYPGITSIGGFGAIGGNSPFYNDVPVAGAAAQFTSKVAIPVASLVGSVRSEEDFGIRVRSLNNAVFKSVFYVATVFFGRPTGGGGKAFFRNATDCAAQADEAPVQSLEISTWQEQGRFAGKTETLPPVSGCEKLSFGPDFSFQPTANTGSSVAGANAHLHFDQSALTDPDTLATPDLKRSVVKLPAGFDVNPSQANGLEACSEAQVGYEAGAKALALNPTRFNNDPVSCPDGSKLGIAEATTPLLEEPLKGTIYLAKQHENPFDSLIALYLVFESPRFGVTLKLPGKVELDPATGQVSATFDHVPQQPVDDLTLHFRGGGPRSEFATPETCGTYTTHGEWEPWSAPESGPNAQTADSFTVSSNCAASPATRPFSPGFEAGSADPVAGAFSPLLVKVTRKDGEQELRSLDFTFPPGIAAKLAGVPYCPDAAIAAAQGKSGRDEQGSPSCPDASRIGSTDAAAGAGSEPFHTPGAVYLAGSYRGAPLSAVAITPAVAGPFDLGNVVIRTPLYIDPVTAQVTAKSDPIPTILEGIPLKLRSVAISIDRSGFSTTPTSCEEMQVRASIGSSDGATATPSNRFQVGECARLPFKPRIALRLKGGTTRSAHPKLIATVHSQGLGVANLARTQVKLPHSAFIDQGHIRTVCTRVQFAAGAGNGAECPPGSIYGRVSVKTPLFDYALSGNVYLRSSNHVLPDLILAIHGPASQPVAVELAGKTDSVKGALRNTFEAIPDAPFSEARVVLFGGKRGLVVNSRNLCTQSKSASRANVRLWGQNGESRQLHPLVRNSCGKAHRKKHRGHKRRR